MRLTRALVLTGTLFGLPITCAQNGDGIYSAGVEPSPAGRVNPMEPGFVNGGGNRR